jgi:hypothetical protein
VARRVERGLGAPSDIGRVRVGEVLDEDAERPARLVAELARGPFGARAEPARGLVADESELLDRRADAVTGSFGHEVWPV